jgi:putative nucleotidyltransferase with HDIG domain
MSLLKGNMPDWQQAWQHILKGFRGHSFWRYTPQMLMAFIIVTSTALMFPHQKSYQFSHLAVGDVYMGDEIIAPFTFFIDKSNEEYDKDKRRAGEEVPLVFTRLDSVPERALRKFNEFVSAVEALKRGTAPDSIEIRQLQDILNRHSIIIEQQYVPLLLARGTTESSTRRTREAPEPGATRPGSLQASFDFEALKSNLRRILVDVFTIGVLDVESDAIASDLEKISIVANEQETIEDASDFYPATSIDRIILDDKLRQTYPDHDVEVKIGYAIVTAFMEPNLIHDATETAARVQEAVSKVPLAKGTVLSDERIVDKHERITPATLEKLNSLAKARSEKDIRAGGLKLVFPYIGRILIIGLALSLTAIFLFTARRRTFDDVKRMTMIFIILMLIIVFTFIINEVGITQYKYLIPISIASMLLTIFFDTRTAFMGTVTLSILIGALRGNDFDIMLITLFVGTVSILSTRQIQARSWILKGILFIAVAYILSIASLEFIRNPDAISQSHFLFGMANGLFSPILTYGLMIIFEYVFKMTTDSTLLELSDLNKPLLRQVAIRAPGTNHHSIMVGNLCEAAAEAIGASPLLARVASYYHDIGKMEMAEYFVENQKAGKNPHEKLSPSMSCLILINHVKRGLEIAEEYGLPKEIKDIIPQHHGTNLISFFYQKALENGGSKEINESDFRYPGPKPQTKEAGLVMLADAVEAGSRTLKEPTVSRIRSLVNSFVHEKITNGELDECPLTMKDLKLIRESFVTSLTGIFHGRIKYPDQEQKLFGKKKNSVVEKTSEVVR